MPRQLTHYQKNRLQDWSKQLNTAISKWIDDNYHRKVQISVQFASDVQGIFRAEPCNKVCYDHVLNDGQQFVCDASDLAMKMVVIDEAENGRFSAIMYKCHRDVSNIAIPYWDSVTESQWYIFMGQFIGVRCHASKSCKGTCEGANIRIAERKELNRTSSLYVKPGNLYNRGVFNHELINGHPAELKDPAEFTIPELAVCMTIAIEQLRMRLPALSEAVKKKIAKYGGSRYNPDDPDIFKGIKKNLNTIQGVFSEDISKEVEKLLKMEWLRSGKLDGLKDRRLELICVSREIDNSELIGEDVKKVRSYISHLAKIGTYAQLHSQNATSSPPNISQAQLPASYDATKQ